MFAIHGQQGRFANHHNSINHLKFTGHAKYGLIGYPLGHSFSKNYFNQKFESENIDATYLNFEIPNIKDLKTVLKDNPELNGLNVTIPYKEQVIPYLDDLDEDARLIGAVNVIKFTKGLFGKN